MGYRLDIAIIERYENEEIKTLYYGTKLYGYQLELSESLSYEFLQTINKMNGEEYFNYGIDNTVILNYKELCLFLKLYNIDYNNYPYIAIDFKQDMFINLPEINDIIVNVGKYEDSNFIISWV